MNSLSQGTFLSRGISKHFLRQLCSEGLNQVLFDEFVQRTLTTDIGVGFEITRILMHGDMYYSVEDGEGRRSIRRVRIVDRHALFVLQIGVPDWMGEEV